METIGERIVTIALELLRDRPDGIRYSDLVRMVSESDNTLKLNTYMVTSGIWTRSNRTRFISPPADCLD